MNVAAKLIIVTRGHKILHEQEERKKEKNNHKLLTICSKEEKKTVFFNYQKSFFLLFKKNYCNICYIMNLTCRFSCLFDDCVGVVVIVSVDSVVAYLIMYITIYRYNK